MIKLYFGLPGSGKTTLLCKHALNASRGNVYQNIYSNTYQTVPGVTYIPNNLIGKVDLSNCLLLIDEATLFADNRNYKNFSDVLTQFFMLHRHYKCDINLYTQQWDGVDKKIRVVTDRVYYVHKGFLLGRWLTRAYRIPYGILIPSAKDTGSNKYGEIVQGYVKPPFYIRIFGERCWRRKYYEYFDSFECPPLPEYAREPNPGRKIKLTKAEKRAIRKKVWKDMRNSLSRRIKFKRPSRDTHGA